MDHLLFLGTDSDKAKIQGIQNQTLQDYKYIKVTGLENVTVASSFSFFFFFFFFFFTNLLSRRGKAFFSSQKGSVAHPASYSL